MESNKKHMSEVGVNIAKQSSKDHHKDSLVTEPYLLFKETGENGLVMSYEYSMILLIFLLWGRRNKKEGMALGNLMKKQVACDEEPMLVVASDDMASQGQGWPFPCVSLKCIRSTMTRNSTVIIMYALWGCPISFTSIVTKTYQALSEKTWQNFFTPQR